MKYAKHLMMFTIILCVFFISLCNPISENISDPLWNSLHNSKPFQSDTFHSADYRFPHGACDEVQCHGISLTGGNSGAPSCILCHDDQWTIFGVSHTKKISGYYHRYDVSDFPADRDSNANWFSSCKTALCHENDLEGTQGGPSANFAYRYSCKVCHSHFLPNTIPPPGHSKNKSEDGASGWHHYNYESSDPDNNNANCSGAACHGDGNSGGSAGTSFAGLAGHGPACSDCHD